MGQILPNQDIQHAINSTDIMLNLFFVPIIHKNSPIAYIIIRNIHWYHKVAKHSGVETLFNVFCFAEGLCYRRMISYETNQKKVWAM